MDVALWAFTVISVPKISSGLVNVWHGVRAVDGTKQWQETTAGYDYDQKLKVCINFEHVIKISLIQGEGNTFRIGYWVFPKGNK